MQSTSDIIEYYTLDQAREILKKEQIIKAKRKAKLKAKRKKELIMAIKQRVINIGIIGMIILIGVISKNTTASLLIIFMAVSYNFFAKNENYNKGKD